MPGYDRTGPMGQGPRTGGGFGYCGSARAGRGSGGGANYGVGTGGRPFGGGRGRCWGGRPGRGWNAGWNRRGYEPAFSSPESNREDLQAEADALRAELQEVEKRLADLETAPSTD